MGLLYGRDSLEKRGYKVFYVFQWCFVIITSPDLKGYALLQEPFPLDGIIRRGSPQDDFGALEDWAESSTKGSPTDRAGDMF